MCRNCKATTDNWRDEQELQSHDGQLEGRELQNPKKGRATLPHRKGCMANPPNPMSLFYGGRGDGRRETDEDLKSFVV